MRRDRYERKARTDEVAKALAEVEADLLLPPFPAALGYLWRAYLRLRRRTPGGFSGPQPVGWQDIDAFVRRSGHELAPWEVELIERLDDLFLAPDPAPALPDGQTVKVAASARDAGAVKAVMGSVGKGRRVVTRAREASK